MTIREITAHVCFEMSCMFDASCINNFLYLALKHAKFLVNKPVKAYFCIHL